MKYKIIGQIAPHIKNLKDVTVQGNTITFGSSWTKDAADSVVTHATSGNERKKNLIVTAKKKELTTDTKAKILSKITGKIAERIDEFGVYEYRASTDEKDSDNDIFDKSLLDMWAIQGNADGVPFVFRHDYDEPLGSVFGARVERNEVENRWELIADVFVLPDAEVGSLKAIDCIDAAIYKNCSVRVRTGVPKVIEGENWYDTYYVYSADPNSKWLELSLVPYGANKNANQTKEQNFKIIENMEIIKANLVHLGREVEVTAELAKSMSEEIHKFRQKEAAAKTEKVQMFVNKSLTLDPKADKDDLETFANALTFEKLDAKIANLIEKEAAFKANQLNPEGGQNEGRTTLKATSNPVNLFE